MKNILAEKRMTIEPPNLPIHRYFGLLFKRGGASKTGSKKYYWANDDEVQKQMLPAHRMLPYSWCLLLISILWVFVSLVLDLNNVLNEFYLFQRSGAVLVMAALWV